MGRHYEAAAPEDAQEPGVMTKIHTHELHRVVIRQRVDHNVKVQYHDGFRARDYGGPAAPHLILAWKCRSCDYRRAYDLVPAGSLEKAIAA
jgi:hypothetical protein